MELFRGGVDAYIKLEWSLVEKELFFLFLYELRSSWVFFFPNSLMEVNILGLVTISLIAPLLRMKSGSIEPVVKYAENTAGTGSKPEKDGHLP